MHRASSQFQRRERFWDGFTYRPQGPISRMSEIGPGPDNRELSVNGSAGNIGTFAGGINGMFTQNCPTQTHRGTSLPPCRGTAVSASLHPPSTPADTSDSASRVFVCAWGRIRSQNSCSFRRRLILKKGVKSPIAYAVGKFGLIDRMKQSMRSATASAFAVRRCGAKDFNRVSFAASSPALCATRMWPRASNSSASAT